eukprot:986902-Prorocentrum_minimum.AAC.2
MPVVTRYQHNNHLYESVLEQPLLLENILSHLSAKDGINLKLTNNTFTKQERLDDTISLFLDKKYKEFLKHENQKKLNKFINTVGDHLKTFESLSNAHFRHRIVQANVMFDYLVDNAWFLDETALKPFTDVVERKLINMLIEDPFEYGQHALHYLQVMFGVQLNARPHPEFEDSIQEYIFNRKGELIVLP